MRRSGFTLIELLIVVAIIGILAAIAVPNFLNARIRANVARTRADLRSVGMAENTYMLDHGNPIPVVPGAWSSADPRKLTTPVAYLPQLPIDVFNRGEDINPETRWFLYFSYYIHERTRDNLESSLRAMGLVGLQWQVWSLGPDGELTEPDGSYSGVIAYAASNGLISKGDIFISNLDPLGTEWGDRQKRS